MLERCAITYMSMLIMDNKCSSQKMTLGEELQKILPQVEIIYDDSKPRDYGILDIKIRVKDPNTGDMTCPIGYLTDNVNLNTAGSYTW